jgi:hypothetical protein
MYENTMHLKQSTTYIEDGKIYLKLSYTYEDDGIHEVTFPKIDLGFYTEQIPSVENRLPSYAKVDNCYGDSFYLRGVRMPEYDCPIYSFDKLIKPAVKEMTIEEIEKKLGYPIKIVNKKEN